MRTTSGKFLGVTVLAVFRVKRVDIKTAPRRSSSHPFFFFNAVDCFRYGSIDRARPRIYKFPDHWPRCVRDRVIL